METKPLVSVLMTAYNREKYIAEAIESVLASTYTNFELILVDDCSTDNTLNIARQYAAKDERIQVFSNSRNLGQFPNRNKAASYAKGTYLVTVDSDDKILRNGIQDLVDTMDQNPGSSFGVFTRIFDKVTVLPPAQAIRENFFKKPFLQYGPGATILRRDYFNKIGGYPEDYGIPGDMFFNLKASCQTPVTLIPFEFMQYRRHGEQELNNSYDYLYNNYKYLHDALDQLPLGLEPNEIDWLLKKAKRRFTVNIIKYFCSTFNIPKTIFALKQARFTFRDACIGIFHF